MSEVTEFSDVNEPHSQILREIDRLKNEYYRERDTFNFWKGLHETGKRILNTLQKNEQEVEAISRVVHATLERVKGLERRKKRKKKVSNPKKRRKR